MLNTLPPSPTCPHPPSSVSRPVRRRGGQPSNHNALRYGCFARRNPTPLTLLVNSIRVSTAGLESLPAVLRQAILDLRLQIARLLAVRPDGGDLRATLAWHRPIVRLIDLILRLHKTLARYETPQHHLQFVAQHALALIRYEFRESGITRDAYSFRAKTELSDLNSSALQEDGITHAVDSVPRKD